MNNQPDSSARHDVLKYKFLRWLGRFTVETASFLTFGKMPPMVSAAGIIRVDDAVLTIRDVAQRMLVLPGGHLHWRESPEAGLIREVREETGYIVEPVRLFGAFSSDSGFSDRGIIRIIYEARLIGGEERSSPEGDVAWLKLDQLDGEKSRDAGIIRQWLESGAQVAR